MTVPILHRNIWDDKHKLKTCNFTSSSSLANQSPGTFSPVFECWPRHRRPHSEHLDRAQQWSDTAVDRVHAWVRWQSPVDSVFCPGRAVLVCNTWSQICVSLKDTTVNCVLIRQLCECTPLNHGLVNAESKVVMHLVLAQPQTNTCYGTYWSSTSNVSLGRANISLCIYIWWVYIYTSYFGMLTSNRSNMFL